MDCWQVKAWRSMSIELRISSSISIHQVNNWKPLLAQLNPETSSLNSTIYLIFMHIWMFLLLKRKTQMEWLEIEFEFIIGIWKNILLIYIAHNGLSFFKHSPKSSHIEGSLSIFCIPSWRSTIEKINLKDSIFVFRIVSLLCACYLKDKIWDL